MFRVILTLSFVGICFGSNCGHDCVNHYSKTVDFGKKEIYNFEGTVGFVDSLFDLLHIASALWSKPESDLVIKIKTLGFSAMLVCSQCSHACFTLLGWPAGSPVSFCTKH